MSCKNCHSENQRILNGEVAIHLSGFAGLDKPAVFAEMFRVLTPGGRIGISDVVAEDALSAEQRAERGSYVGCIAGALSMTEYRHGLEAAGFGGIEITPTHQVAEGMHSAIVHATKPASGG